LFVQARFFTESRLLQRAVKVEVLSIPAPGPSPFQQTNAASAAHTASIFIGNGMILHPFTPFQLAHGVNVVLHPNGNIAEHLVGAGLATVVGWQIGLVGAQGAERLRAAEKAAKEKRLCLYANPAPGSASASASAPHTQANGSSRSFDATVVRVWSGDQISVVDKSGKERRLQLSSVRAPRLVIRLQSKQAHTSSF
jgi:staphylococcal nuclease domain-containing protein 1